MVEDSFLVIEKFSLLIHNRADKNARFRQVARVQNVIKCYKDVKTDIFC